MIDIKTSLKESGVTEFSYKLREFATTIDAVRNRSEDITVLDSIENDIIKNLESVEHNLLDRLLAYSLLGNLCNTKRCLTLSVRIRL